MTSNKKRIVSKLYKPFIYYFFLILSAKNTWFSYFTKGAKNKNTSNKKTYRYL